MSNALNNNTKISQLIKVEKENGNIELRKRMRSLTKDKFSPNKKETVWDRLSKIKKIPSTEKPLSIARSRHNLSTKTSQHFQTVRQMVKNQSQQANSKIVCRKPLSPNLNRRLNAVKKYSLTQTIVRPEIKNQKFAYVREPQKSVKELIATRRLTNSESSLDNKSKSILSVSVSQRLNCQFDYRSEDTVTSIKNVVESSEYSNDEYELAPLMSSISFQQVDSSTKIINDFRAILRHKDRFMASHEIEQVKDVIKSDHRYRNLKENNPGLFKEILTTQLQNILSHEIAVKSALNKLDSSVSLQSSHEVQKAQPVEEIVSYTDNKNQSQKLEVDVVFKNFPSLENEIKILRALGEKLEATLKSTSSQRSDQNKSLESVALTTGPSSVGPSIDAKVFVVLKTIYQCSIISIEYNAQVSLIPLGICHVFGIVKEFNIAQKTIIELKQEANQPFYIPMNPKASVLKRTSFKKLKENPDILLRQIKPKSLMVAFNFLEQDPIFFNNLIFNKTNKTSSQESLAVPENYVNFPCEGGDNRILSQKVKDNQIFRHHIALDDVFKEHDEVFIESQKHIIDKEIPKESDDVLKETQKLMESVITGKQRRRIRRYLTPIPLNKNCNEKNSLLKTILVGCVQIHLFILLIMAITYPDPKC